MSSGKKILFYSTLFIVTIYFLFLGLFEAKGFLIPITTAVILALVILPMGQALERKGVNRGFSSFLSTFSLFLISLAFMALVSFQIQSFVSKWPQIKETMKPKVEQAKTYIFQHTPLQKTDLQNSGRNLPFMQGNSRSQDPNSKSTNSKSTNSNDQGNQTTAGPGSSSSGSNSTASQASQKGSTAQAGGGSITSKGKKAFNFLIKTVGFIGSFLLVFIYIFFLLTYRKRFKEFLLRLFPKEKNGEVKQIIHKSATVTQQYLVGKLMLSGVLAVLYSIGLGISGVSNFILISLIAALLNILPYIGNIIGLTLALAFGYLTSGSTGVLISILITFSVAQFVESYILEPYLVGDKVHLHPFMVILVVVMGGAIWGIMGMLLAIPILAIITIVFLHIPPLHPFGFLFSRKSKNK